MYELLSLIYFIKLKLIFVLYFNACCIIIIIILLSEYDQIEYSIFN